MTSASPWVPNGQTELRALPSSFRVYHFPESFRKQVQADPVPLYLADAEGEDPPASKMATTRLPAVIWTEPAGTSGTSEVCLEEPAPQVPIPTRPAPTHRGGRALWKCAFGRKSLSVAWKRRAGDAVALQACGCFNLRKMPLPQVTCQRSRRATLSGPAQRRPRPHHPNAAVRE